MIHTSHVNGNHSIRIQEPTILLNPNFVLSTVLCLLFLSSQLSGQLLSLVFENLYIIY